MNRAVIIVFYLILMWVPTTFAQQLLHQEFITTTLGKERSTVGKDQAEVVKAPIQNFIKSNPNIVITDITVTSTSSKIPFFINKKIDPKSNERNLALANERAFFVKKIFDDMKANSTQLSQVNFVSTGELAGADFEPIDLNDRFVTKMTPGYSELIDSLYRKHEEKFRDQALISSPQVLFDEKQYVNLYQAKFKPFEGFRIQIKGQRKEGLGSRNQGKKQKAAETSRQ